jgi:hypothetical protein
MSFILTAEDGAELRINVWNWHPTRLLLLRLALSTRTRPSS